ncbi:hypothetical protein CCHR01_12617 [Colletotrichum chrysophilum]|uniref:Uncharacterized protein n=1 Tax=Colletotrichum chrysophilum TaxID=1836956 RepID=A0AAD9EHB9_9PEZI|nr:hypothetical protein CCHR01_12617 [Colletotrichum chrysophilum]
MRIMSTGVSGTLADETPDASGTYLPSTSHQRQGVNLMESHHISLTDTARPMIFNNIQRCQWAHAHRPEMVCPKSYAIRPSHRLDPRRCGQAQFPSRAVPLGHSGVRLAGPLRDNRRGEERKKQAPLTMQKSPGLRLASACLHVLVHQGQQWQEAHVMRTTWTLSGPCPRLLPPNCLCLAQQICSPLRVLRCNSTALRCAGCIMPPHLMDSHNASFFSTQNSQPSSRPPASHGSAHRASGSGS